MVGLRVTRRWKPVQIAFHLRQRSLTPSTVHKILRRHGWIAAYNQRGIARRFTKPHRPWTNGKAGRFNRTLQTE